MKIRFHSGRWGSWLADDILIAISSPTDSEGRMPLLDREEYIEQAYFWRTFLERLQDGVPAQEILVQVQEEILATTRLPMALDFLVGEVRHSGRLGDGMATLRHYFTPFQAWVMQKAEDEAIRFDLLMALRILAAEAEFRAEDRCGPAGLFLYQFECLARNRLGYLDGMKAIADDPLYPEEWRTWILWLNQQLGSRELSEFLYLRSEFMVEEKRRAAGDPQWQASTPILFGVREGRIAKANRGKDPLYMFAALQRQLGYPVVPRPKARDEERVFHPLVEQRFQLLEKRVILVEQELKGGVDLSQFYVNPSQKRPEDTAPGRSG